MKPMSIRRIFMLLAASWALTLGVLLVALDTAEAAPALRTHGFSSAQKIAVFEDVVINPGETWKNVIVVGGDVTVSGTVENVLVVIGGDASIQSGAQVGVGHDQDKQAIVVVFGTASIEAGALVIGDVALGWKGPKWLSAATIAPDYAPWNWGSFVGWLWRAILVALVAIVVVAIAPRQVGFVRTRIRDHFLSSLGWGVLLAVIGVPLISILLIISLVGVLLLVPWLAVVVPLVWLFGLVSLGAMFGGFILRRRTEERGPLMLEAVLGVVILSFLWWIPVVGGLIVLVPGLVGFGATWVSIWDWRRSARRRLQ